VIKLSEATKGMSGITVELEKRIKEVDRKIKISTSYPTIALFIIGFAFIAAGLLFAKSTVQTFTIVGQLPIQDPSSATVIVASGASNFFPDSDGKLNRVVEFSPEVRRLMVIVNAPGYSPSQSFFTLNAEDAKNRQLSFPDDLKFTKVSDKPTTPGRIVAPRDNVALAPLSQPPTF
jgi:hypothetical protein